MHSYSCCNGRTTCATMYQTPCSIQHIWPHVACVCLRHPAAAARSTEPRPTASGAPTVNSNSAGRAGRGTSLYSAGGRAYHTDMVVGHALRRPDCGLAVRVCEDVPNEPLVRIRNQKGLACMAHIKVLGMPFCREILGNRGVAVPRGMECAAWDARRSRCSDLANFDFATETTCRLGYLHGVR